ncbi:hypothetical protein XELAEV_18038722mg [Xenopus laevis]|uniref:Uncharacterized protein n=1 Tax=Xenopus laevis TaxID=8355 RepID=A0A974H7P8_XENLA|nr:hypothetical protein XELAEV_18038722mg [Xenopus laevis]
MQVHAVQRDIGKSSMVQSVSGRGGGGVLFWKKIGFSKCQCISQSWRTMVQLDTGGAPFEVCFRSIQNWMQVSTQHLYLQTCAKMT